MNITEEINGNTYATNKMLPKEAIKTGVRLMKMIAPLASCLQGLSKVGGDTKVEDLVSDSDAMGILGAGFSSVNEDEFVDLLEMLCRKATKNGSRIAGLNTSFQDEEGNVLLVDAVKVAVFVVKSNFNKKMLSLWGNSQAGVEGKA